jgi:hypothetical protein
MRPERMPGTPDKDRSFHNQAAGGYFFRKSVGVGPFRLKFLESGIGASRPGRKRREPRAEARRRGFTD